MFSRKYLQKVRSRNSNKRQLQLIKRHIVTPNIFGEVITKGMRKSNKKQFELINRDIVTPDEVYEVFIGFGDELTIDNMSTFI